MSQRRFVAPTVVAIGKSRVVHPERHRLSEHVYGRFLDAAVTNDTAVIGHIAVHCHLRAFRVDYVLYARREREIVFAFIRRF